MLFRVLVLVVFFILVFVLCKCCVNIDLLKLKKLLPKLTFQVGFIPGPLRGTDTWCDGVDGTVETFGFFRQITLKLGRWAGWNVRFLIELIFVVEFFLFRLDIINLKRFVSFGCRFKAIYKHFPGNCWWNKKSNDKWKICRKLIFSELQWNVSMNSCVELWNRSLEIYVFRQYLSRKVNRSYEQIEVSSENNSHPNFGISQITSNSSRHFENVPEFIKKSIF